MKFFSKKRISGCLPFIAVSAFVVICCLPLLWILINKTFDTVRLFSNLNHRSAQNVAIPEIRLPHLSPWASIGGCGAGGSGGGSGDGIKWIGNHVGGGLVDIEAMMKLSGGENFINYSTPLRISGKPFQNITAAITIPVINFKAAEVQYQTNREPEDRKTGGFGDITFDVSKSFGAIGQFSLMLSLSIPTGQYDIARGTDKTQNLLPVSLQMGSGLYTAGLTFSGSRDFENGILLMDFSCSYPFNLSVSGENRFLDEYFQDYVSRKNNKRFYYHYKMYGENDLGGFTPATVSLGAFYGYKGKPRLMHSWGAVFFVPLGVAWIHSEKVGLYDPKPDPDHKAWSAAIVYGIESTNRKFPVYFAISKPIHDKTSQNISDPYDSSPMKKWDGPDWKDFLNQWTIAAGVKASLF